MIVSRAVQFTAEDCARLDGFVMRALRDMRLRNELVPRDVLELLASVHQLAGEFRETTLVTHRSGTAFDQGSSGRGPSEATETLSVPQAARLTGWSQEYLRRLARKGVVSATRTGSRGGWRLDGGQLAALRASRDRDETREVA